MDLMPLSIKTFFHAFNSTVYPIFFFFPFKISTFLLQEDNDQAFSLSC
jgi:hypothetical protein